VCRRIDDTGDAVSGNLTRLGRQTGDGHAFVKHVVEGGEFPGIRTRSELAAVVDDVIGTAAETRSLSGGRTAYWKNGVVVIHNPSAADGGTVFVPSAGYDYFLGLR
jgi:hypothetical protein